VGRLHGMGQPEFGQAFHDSPISQWEQDASTP